MRKIERVLAACAAVAMALPAYAATIYSNDFESGSTAGITGVTSITTAPGNGQKYLGPLAVGSSSTLTVGTGSHTNLVLSFDLYALNSLDGDGDDFCCGPDSFKLMVNGGTLLDNTFSNNTGWSQTYGGLGSPGGTGSDGTLTGLLGYSYYGPDHTYHLTFNLGDSASTIIDFFGNTNQGWSDEGFGIDNIVLSGERLGNPVPEPSTWAMMIAGFALIGGAMRRRLRGKVLIRYA